MYAFQFILHAARISRKLLQTVRVLALVSYCNGGANNVISNAASKITAASHGFPATARFSCSFSYIY